MGTRRAGRCFMRGCVTLLAFASLWWGTAATSIAEDVTILGEEELFRLAMGERDHGNPYTSIELFHSILSGRPSLHRARLELAVAYYRTLQWEKAIEHANKVLADPTIPKNVRLAVLAFLAQVKKEQESYSGRQFWRFPLAAGILIDSNVTAGPDSEIIPGLLFTLTPSSTQDSDVAGVFSAGINHTYTTGKAVRTGRQPSILVWQSSINFYDRSYNDRDDFDLDIFSIRTGPGLISRDRNLRANLNFQWDGIYFSQEYLADFYSFMPSITWSHSNDNGGNLEITFDGVLAYHNYRREIDADRDANFWSGGLSTGYVFPGNSLAAQVGFFVFIENADSTRRSNEGWNINGALLWNITEKTSAHGRIGYKNIKFDGPEPAATEARDETESQYTIGIHQALWRRDDTKLDLNIETTYIDNNSNVYWFDYSRNLTLITLDLTF
jgi:hypothetical protein